MNGQQYAIDGQTQVEAQASKDWFSFLIYKSATSYKSNITYLFSTWAIGSFLAAKTLTDWYL